MFELTKSELEQIEIEAREYVACQTICKTYQDVYPAIKPIIDSGGKTGEAVDFLIERGIVTGQERAAAIRGFNRAKKKWN